MVEVKRLVRIGLLAASAIALNSCAQAPVSTTAIEHPKESVPPSAPVKDPSVWESYPVPMEHAKINGINISDIQNPYIGGAKIFFMENFFTNPGVLFSCVNWERDYTIAKQYRQVVANGLIVFQEINENFKPSTTKGDLDFGVDTTDLNVAKNQLSYLGGQVIAEENDLGKERTSCALSKYPKTTKDYTITFRSGLAQKNSQLTPQSTLNIRLHFPAISLSFK